MSLQNRTARPGRLGTLVVLIAVLGLIIPTTALGILAIERVSASSTGAQGNGDSWVCKPSADGRFVVFYSESSQLVPGDTNHVGDVFVRDRLTGRVERANVSSAGGQSDAQSYDADISADGRYVVFASRATNLIGAGLDTDASSDVFVRDRFAHTTRRVSVGAAGVQGSGDSDGARISTDGRYVVFVSAAANLVGTEDTNARSDIFRRDRIGNTTVRVSLGGSGLQADGYSDDPAVNASGRYVAFESAATNLVGAGVDTNSQDDIYVRDIDFGTTSRASV